MEEKNDPRSIYVCENQKCLMKGEEIERELWMKGIVASECCHCGSRLMLIKKITKQ